MSGLTLIRMGTFFWVPMEGPKIPRLGLQSSVFLGCGITAETVWTEARRGNDLAITLLLILPNLQTVRLVSGPRGFADGVELGVFTILRIEIGRGLAGEVGTSTRTAFF